MRLTATCLAAVLAPLSLHASPLGDAAAGLNAAMPADQMRAATALCLEHLEDFDGAMAGLGEALWEGDADDGGLITMGYEDVQAIFTPDGLCRIESALVPLAEARAIATDLVVLGYGGFAVQAPDDDGCTVVWSDEAPRDGLLLSTGGNDPQCEPLPEAGSAITIGYVYE